MPRTAKDILDHADQLVKRFEDYEPKPEDERDAAVFTALRRASVARADAERDMQRAVTDARRDGWSWREIGWLAGTSGEAARQRYAAHVEP